VTLTTVLRPTNYKLNGRVEILTEHLMHVSCDQQFGRTLHVFEVGMDTFGKRKR